MRRNPMLRQSDNPRFVKDFRMRNRTSACALYLVVMAVPALAQASPRVSAQPAWTQRARSLKHDGRSSECQFTRMGEGRRRKCGPMRV